MHRRGLLAAIAASTSVAVAGCAGGENGSYEFDAEPASVPSSAASEAGYEGEEPKPFTIEQEFDVAGVNAQVSATTWAAGYENSENGSALFVASTPNASVGGQSVNPLVRADDAELIRRLLEQVDQRGIGGEGTDIEASNIENRGQRPELSSVRRWRSRSSKRPSTQRSTAVAERAARSRTFRCTCTSGRSNTGRT